MEITRLKVKVVGTKRSRTIEDGEIFEMSIPTWMPNPDLDLYSLNDFIEFVSTEAPFNSGDRVLSILVQDAVVQDGTDPVNIIESDHTWSDRYDVVHNTLQSMWHEIGGVDRTEIAFEIYQQYQHMFGWGNGDPADAIEDISISLLSVLEVLDEDASLDDYSIYSSEKQFMNSARAVVGENKIFSESPAPQPIAANNTQEPLSHTGVSVPWYELAFRVYYEHSISSPVGQANFQHRLNVFEWNVPCRNVQFSGDVYIGPWGGLEILYLAPGSKEEFEAPLDEDAIKECLDKISTLEYVTAISPIATLAIYRRMIQNTGVSSLEFKAYSDSLGPTYGRLFGSVVLGLTMFTYFSDKLNEAMGNVIEFEDYLWASTQSSNALVHDHWAVAAKPMMSALMDDKAKLSDVEAAIADSGEKMRNFDWTQFVILD